MSPRAVGRVGHHQRRFALAEEPRHVIGIPAEYTMFATDPQIASAGDRILRHGRRLVCLLLVGER